jgi:spore coat protein U-like protein
LEKENIPGLKKCLAGPKSRRQIKEEVMKKSFVVTAAIAIVIAMAGGAYAAGSTASTVNATGTVIDACQFGGSPAIDFGSVDATSGLVTGVVAQPSLWCTTSYTAAVTDNGGQNGVSGTSWNLKNGANLIGYVLTYTAAPVGAGKGTTNLMTIGATIPSGNLDNAPAGVYTDAVVLTITY